MDTLITRDPTTRTGPASLRAPECRIEGRDKVTGLARYAADISRPNQLWAAFATSTVPHARITAVDTSAARRMPGVRAVLTAKETGECFLGRALMDWPVLAADKVLFVGQYVAAVAADSPERAEAAAREIEIRYDELPGVFEPADALVDGAPILHERPERYTFLHGSREPALHANVQGQVIDEIGDAQSALQSAHRVFEHRFRTPPYHAGYIEPHACQVWIDEHDIVHVITTNKSPFQLRAQLAASTGLPVGDIVVESAFIGGDFGGKGLSIDEFACYHLARSTGQPVKYVRRYLYDVQSTNVRHAAEITIRTGLTAQKRISAMDIRVTYNGGAFAAGKPLKSLVPGHMFKIPYAVPNGRIASMAVYTNTVPGGHLRAPAEVQLVFALESHMDMIAHELGIDPLGFRRENAVCDGNTDFEGIPYRQPAAREILDALEQCIAERGPLPPESGRGISLAARHIGPGAAGVVLRLHASGRLEAVTGVSDQGAGATTVIARTIAEIVGLPPQRISVIRGNTAQARFDLGPGASRITHIVGSAAAEAARTLRRKLDRLAWNGSEDTWPAIARRLTGERDIIEIEGQYTSPAHGAAEWHNFSAYAVEVQVDRETGAVRVTDALYVADVGTIINPVAHQGQIDGGFVFGLGIALTEEFRCEDGKITTLSLADYKLPSQQDCPPLRTHLLHANGGPGPFGAKGVGEISTPGVGPAIANAVFAACSVRIQEMPITAERIYDALEHHASRAG